MADITHMFDPLPEGNVHCSEPGTDERNADWQPVCPVPDGAPEPDFRHPNLGLAVAHWTYRDADGRALGHVARFEPDNERKRVLPLTFCRGANGEQEWRFKGFPDPRPIYDLEQLAKRPDDPVLITEGEKTVNKAAQLFPEFVVVTSPGGAKAAAKCDWSPMAFRTVFIWPDNDAEGLEYAKAVAKLCIKAGAVRVHVAQVPDGFPEKWDLADPRPDEWPLNRLRALLENTEPFVSTPAGLLQELDRSHAVIMVGGKCAVLNEEWDPTLNRKQITLSTRSDFKNYYANKFITDAKGNKVGIADVWWRDPKRRQYRGMIFDPEGGMPGYYNLWTGFAVDPKPGDCSLFLVHVRDVVACGDEEVYHYIMAWMADAMQNPARRPGTSIVLRGKQGTGKGICCTEFGKLLGQHFVHVQHARHLTGHFNAHLKDALVVLADEAFWAGDKSAEGALKAMVTEERLPIEFKGKDVIYVKNHIRLMIASNHDWVVPAGLEERRFFVVDVSEARMQDQKYFVAIIEQMETGGREALLDYLLNYDLTGIDLRKFPQTDALREQKIHSMSPVEKWWFDRLMAGAILSDDREWRSCVPCNQVQEDFLQHAKNIGYARRSSETELGMVLGKLVPGLGKARRTVGGGRQNVYNFPSLILGDETLHTIARELVATVRNNVTIDWTLRENVRAQLRVLVKRILRKYGYPPDKQEKATQTVLEQAEVLSAGWAA